MVHPGEVESIAPTPPERPRRRVRLGLTIVASAGALLIGLAGPGPAGAQPASIRHTSPAGERAGSHGRKPPAKQSKKKGSGHPCLVGTWTVTSLTLGTTGLTFTGGAGTTVDILPNGNAVGNFTPGAPLVGRAGSAKFNGTITDHYGFPSNTTARSGSFESTPVSSNATITVAGATKPVTPETYQGSYTCSGKDLSLNFTAGSSSLAYELVPAG